MTESGIFAIMAVLGAFMLIFAIIGIILYILMSAGLYRMAQNLKIENAWFAWIPILNFYIIGKIVGKIKLGSYEVPSLEMVLPIGYIAIMILSNIPVIGSILGLAWYIFVIMVIHRLYSLYRPQSATLWTVLSFIFVIPISICIFIIRNDQRVEISDLI